MTRKCFLTITTKLCSRKPYIPLHTVRWLYVYSRSTQQFTLTILPNIKIYAKVFTFYFVPLLLAHPTKTPLKYDRVVQGHKIRCVTFRSHSDTRDLTIITCSFFVSTPSFFITRTFRIKVQCFQQTQSNAARPKIELETSGVLRQGSHEKSPERNWSLKCRVNN